MVIFGYEIERKTAMEIAARRKPSDDFVWGFLLLGLGISALALVAHAAVERNIVGPWLILLLFFPYSMLYFGCTHLIKGIIIAAWRAMDRIMVHVGVK